jgi:ribonucleotide reductase beta subunit family protein with ferritin-like domain
LYSQIQEVGRILYEHEEAIIEKFYEKGDLKVEKEHFKTFVKYRINYCLSNFGIEPIFDIEGKQNPIKEWFGDKITKGYVANDFFNTIGREYSTRFVRNKFEWSNE